jgi:hypothetical protein
MKTATSKSGRVLTDRDYETYTGDCPPERPCSQELIASRRRYFDATDSQRDANYNRCIHHGKTITELRDGRERAVTIENPCTSCGGKKLENLVQFWCLKLENVVTVNDCSGVMTGRACEFFAEKAIDTPATTS